MEGPHPSALRAATFPIGEGLFCFSLLQYLINSFTDLIKLIIDFVIHKPQYMQTKAF